MLAAITTVSLARVRLRGCEEHACDATEGIVHRHGGRRDRHGLALLGLPGFVLASLLGIQSATVDALFIGRLTGAVLLALGVASAVARDDARSPAQRGLLVGFLTYNVLAAVLFVYAGLGVQLVGPALCPPAVLHTLLALWCLLCPGA
jgi:hypothetical protein